MSITYTPTTNFGSKDVLPANDPNKVIVGAEFTSEFNAIQAAFALAAPTSNPTFSGTATYAAVTVSGTSTLGVLNAGTTTVGTFTSTGIDDNATATALTVTDSGIAATLTTAAQPNITSVGTLAGFTSTGIDDNATSTAITIDSSENVGIGTDSPDGTLHVKDTIAQLYVQSNDGQPSQVVFGDVTDASGGMIEYTSTDAMAFKTNNLNERMRIDSTGNVGIGETAPSEFLHISGAAPAMRLDNSSGTTDWLMQNVSDSIRWVSVPSGGGSSAERMRIDSSGNVGINETNPSTNLQVSSPTGGNAYLEVARKNSNASAVRIAAENGLTGLYSQGDEPLALGANNTEAMRIDATGNVGINTTNPSVYGGLVIAQDANTSSDGFAVVDSTLAQSAKLWCDGTNSYLSSGNTGNDPLILNTGGGNVGIGTTTPVDQLDVKASGDDERLVRISHPSSPTAAAGYFGFTDTGLGANTGVALGVQYAGGYYDALTINRETRNVGIGTTNPTATMVVEVGNNEPASSGNMDTGMVVQSGNGSRAINMGGSNTGGYNWINSAYANNSSVAANLVLMTGAQERMRINSSGNVGIGTDNPRRKLEVADTGAAIISLQSTDSDNCQIFFGDAASETAGKMIYRHDTNSMSFETNSAERMVIDSSGNAVIGGNGNAYSSGSTTITPTGDISNSSASGVASTLNLAGIGGVSNGFQITTNTSNQHEYTFLNGAAVAMKLDTSGNLLVGTTTTIGTGTEGVQIAPNLIITGRNQTSDQTHHVFKNPNGTVGRIRTLNNATDYVTSSDERLKENIVDAPAGNIDSIKVRSFDWKADGEHQDYGFIAQELETVAPYAVSKGETENDMWGVDYSKLVPMLVKEIQDLKAKVEALENA